MNNYLCYSQWFDGTYRDTNTYTNDNVSPEALMTMGAFLTDTLRQMMDYQ